MSLPSTADVIVARACLDGLRATRDLVAACLAVGLGDGLSGAGDHRDTQTIHGALVSGERAAAAVGSRSRRVAAAA